MVGLTTISQRMMMIISVYVRNSRAPPKTLLLWLRRLLMVCVMWVGWRRVCRECDKCHKLQETNDERAFPQINEKPHAEKTSRVLIWWNAGVQLFNIVEKHSVCRSHFAVFHYQLLVNSRHHVSTRYYVLEIVADAHTFYFRYFFKWLFLVNK